MRHHQKVLLWATVALATAAPAAGATTGPAMLTSRSPVGIASNTAATSGNTASFPGSSYTFPSVAGLGCDDVSFDVTTPVATDTLALRPTFAGCTVKVAGTVIATGTIDVNCEWTLAFTRATFSTTSGDSSGVTVSIPCQTTVTLPAVGCTLHVAAVPGTGAISAQNIDGTGANDVSASPWGVKIVASLSGLRYTTTQSAGGNCVFPATGTLGYDGAVALKNVWGML